MSTAEAPEVEAPETDETPDVEPENEPEHIEGPDVPPEPEPEPEPDPERQESQARIEEVGKKLDGLQKHVTKRLGEILGDDATVIEPCPCCTPMGMPGWVWPGEPPEDVRAELYHYLGSFAPQDYKPDDYARKCDKCNGLGETATGSLVPNMQTITCYDCKGKGWVPVGPERASGVLPIPELPPNGDLHSPEGVLLAPAPQPADTEEIAALKRAGYVVIPPIARG